MSAACEPTGCGRSARRCPVLLASLWIVAAFPFVYLRACLPNGPNLLLLRMRNPGTFVAYSYLSASIGCIRDAFRAGKNPDTTPTMVRIVNEMIITPTEACRKIAP